MNSPSRRASSRFAGTGEPRSGDVAITILTALILGLVLLVAVVLG
jgi:hypothetical protein